jgi:hypothetical protein
VAVMEEVAAGDAEVEISQEPGVSSQKSIHLLRSLL